MKKQLLILVVMLLTGTVFGQSILNGGFENWTSATFDFPTGYANSNYEAFFRTNAAFNCVKIADPYHGSFALQLTTNTGVNGDTNMAYIVNSSTTNGLSPCQWMGGMAYNQIPTGIRGYYKNNSMPGDSGGILISFRNNGVCLGMYMYKFGGVHSAYTPFSFTFNPPITGTPDTMIFAAVSSDAFNNIQMPGSMLQLDSISFIGASQPLAFNGDFENWQSQTVYKPNDWYIQDGGNASSGVLQTVDKQAGTYAIELQTYLGDKCNNNGNNCHPAAQAGRISNGYFPRNCGGGCQQQGGLPFSNQIDTLCFYYKYVPSGLDTGIVDIAFKKAGIIIMNSGKKLSTSATYQYMELPFNTFGPVDTAIVSFQSSVWTDTLLSFVGSVLKIDEVHFKSQSVGLKTTETSSTTKVYPNPSNDGYFTISNLQAFDFIRIYTIIGQEVNAEITKTLSTAKVHINKPGAYFIQINSRGKITTQKVLVSPN